MSRDGDLSESLSLSLAARLGRRGFVSKLAMGAMGLAGALAGLPAKTAQASGGLVQFGCCTLCRNPTSCSGRCCWQWGCCSGRGFLALICKECYSSRTCGPTCPSSCSAVINTHIRCP